MSKSNTAKLLSIATGLGDQLIVTAIIVNETL